MGSGEGVEEEGGRLGASEGGRREAHDEVERQGFVCARVSGSCTVAGRTELTVVRLLTLWRNRESRNPVVDGGELRRVLLSERGRGRMTVEWQRRHVDRETCQVEDRSWLHRRRRSRSSSLRELLRAKSSSTC